MTISKTLSVVIVLVGIFLLASIKKEPHLVSIKQTELNPTELHNLADQQHTLPEQQNSSESSQVSGSISVRIPTQSICVGEYCDGSMDDDTDFTLIYVPLIGSNGDIGCGSSIIMAPHTVRPSTKAVLDATYRTLFKLKPFSDVKEDDIRNLVGLEDQLFYQQVLLHDGVATLYLQGNTHVIGECMVPEFRAQIERTAMQYDTVNKLRVMINNEAWDWCDYSMADPSEDGCDTVSKYWEVVK